MSNPSLFHALALIACISVMAPPTSANLPDGAGLAFLGGGLGPPFISQCLEGIRSVQGCIPQLISSISGLQPQTISPACCKAFLDIDETCLPKILPFHLDFLPNLKNNCVGRGDTPTIPGLPQTPPRPPPPQSSCSSDDEDEDCDYDG
ncbi:hypothetical protein ACS0TY_031986 [Phlomoides rotata]